MSNRALAKFEKNASEAAEIFAALGDSTRLTLIKKLCDGTPYSISKLSEGSTLSRQGITKHLQVLESAGLVSCSKRGRESLYQYKPQSLHDAASYLDVVSRQWDQALGRLKSHLED